MPRGASPAPKKGRGRSPAVKSAKKTPSKGKSPSRGRSPAPSKSPRARSPVAKRTRASAKKAPRKPKSPSPKGKGPANSPARRAAARPKKRAATPQGRGSASDGDASDGDGDDDDTFHAYAHTADEVVEYLDSNVDEGLTSRQAAAALKKYGANVLAEEDKTSLFELVLEQFDDQLVKILLGAAVVSFAMAAYEVYVEAAHEGEEAGHAAFVEPFVILLILILNAIVGVWQERNADSALEALKKMQSEHAKVLRDGAWRTGVPAEDVVPGDIVMVGPGERVPADCRVVQLLTPVLKLEESAFTGESVTVEKYDEVVTKRNPRNAEKHNMLLAATGVARGRAIAVVTGTAMQTEIGKIQASVQRATEDTKEESTPLKRKLDEFGDNLSKVIFWICVVVWAINYKNFTNEKFHGDWIKGSLYYFKIAVSLAVAAIPEGLPAVITTCLALGTRKMAKKNAIVRKLPSVETLGCTTVICSDKTGTLTTNMMTVVSLAYMEGGGRGGPSFTEHSIQGTGYAPEGDIADFDDAASSAAAEALVRVAAVCNDSRLVYREGADVPFDRDGEPTEAALVTLAEKFGGQSGAGSDPRDTPQPVTDGLRDRYRRVATLEFSRGRKTMSVLVEDSGKGIGAGTRYLMHKGAPERLLRNCTQVRLADGSTAKLTPALARQIEDQIGNMASRALRCLGFAIKEGNLGPLQGFDPVKDADMLKIDPDEFGQYEQGLTFLGLAGMRDPPRSEVRASIERCHEAGIRIVVITGDIKTTAEAICRDIGVFDADEDLQGKSFTGEEFKRLSDAEQRDVLDAEGGLVFSRTEPTDKQDLVRLLKSMDEVAAMTGDGVNDAPALKQADIGIAMGIAGTEVAKQASDMVLADDNFATIVTAVEEGRAIYNNTKAFIRYLISSNIGEVMSIFLTAAMGLPEGLVPVQLLWVNLVTDGPPATALGFNPPDKDVMRKPPRSQKDVLINGWVFFRYMVIGLYVGLATVGVFVYYYVAYDWAGDGHTIVSYSTLAGWSNCSPDNVPDDLKAVQNVDYITGVDLTKNPCEYFGDGKIMASTMSLSVLVTIEMLNALNALSEDGSLLQMPPWANPWLLVAMAFSFALHCVILYVPVLADVFGVAPMSWNDWQLVLWFSVPVIFIDEVLKAVGRWRNERERVERAARAHDKAE